MRDKYLELVALQSECEFLSVQDSIKLTELIKKGDCTEIAVHLLRAIKTTEQQRRYATTG